MRTWILIFSLALVVPFQAAAGKPQAASQLAETHGYAYVNFPKGTRGSIVVQPVSGGARETLDARPDADKYAFGRWLPAGSYRIVEWNGYPWGNYPPFAVEAGRITDLGSLVPINIGGYEVVVLPVRSAENVHDIDAATDEFASLLREHEPLAWTPKAPPKPIALGKQPSGQGLIVDLLLTYERKVNKPSTIAQLKATEDITDFLRIERSIVPPMYEEAAFDKEGNAYFGADLGQIRVRHPDGTWTAIGFDTLRTVASVECAEDGSIVAGSDNGIIRVSSDAGKTWRILQALPTDETVVDIDREGDSWVAISARQITRPNGIVTSDRLTVFTAKGSLPNNLSVAREFNLDQKNLVGWSGVRGQLVHGTYYFNSPPQLYKLDLASATWSAITPPTTVTSHHVDPETGIVTALHAQGAFSKIFVSEDQGTTWKRIGRPPYVIADVQMDSPAIGFASRMNMNAFSSAWEIYAYDPIVDDWKKTSEAPFNCKPLRVSSSYPLLCVAYDASLFRQQDGQWQVEFSAH